MVLYMFSWWLTCDQYHMFIQLSIPSCTCLHASHCIMTVCLILLIGTQAEGKSDWVKLIRVSMPAMIQWSMHHLQQTNIGLSMSVCIIVYHAFSVCSITVHVCCTLITLLSLGLVSPETCMQRWRYSCKWYIYSSTCSRHGAGVSGIMALARTTCIYHRSAAPVEQSTGNSLS